MGRPAFGAVSPHAPRDGVVLLMRTLGAPLTYVLEPLRKHETVTPLAWQEPPPAEWEFASGQRRRRSRRSETTEYYGLEIRLRKPRNEREYPWTVTLASPRLFWRLLKAPDDVIVAVELNLGALFAVMSKLRSRRKVVALVEGDPGYLGKTGSAGVKVLLRRVIARFVDVIVANSPAATNYLVGTLRVDRDRIVEGWWLAGLPGTGDPAAGRQEDTEIDGAPVFLVAGQLIPRKGIDLLLPAIKRYLAECGRCHLRIVGDGPERHRLEQQATELGIQEHTEFVGAIAHQDMVAMLRSCDLLVFPTLYDLVGRVVVEALSVGTPVAVSCRSGAANTLVREGENGVVMDPRDPASMVDALRRATDPELYERILAGARASGAELTPRAAADVIARGVAIARASQ